MSEKLLCPLCLSEFKSLNSHVLHTHKMSIDEFRNQFPNQQLVSDATKQRTSETSKKVGAGNWRKGAKLTFEQKLSISKRVSGEGNPFFGKKHTEQSRKQMSQNHNNVFGDNNPYRRAMQNEQFRINRIQQQKLFWQELKNDPERYAKRCEKSSIKTTQAFLDGKLLSYGKGHKHGWYISSKSELPIYYRSSYEVKFLELCDIEQHIKCIKSASFYIPYIDELEHKRRYIPDFIINDNYVIEIKANFALENQRIILKHNAAKEYCAKNGFQFIVLTMPLKEQFDSFIMKYKT